MAEYLREIKVEVSVDTNKKTTTFRRRTDNINAAAQMLRDLADQLDEEGDISGETTY